MRESAFFYPALWLELEGIGAPHGWVGVLDQEGNCEFVASLDGDGGDGGSVAERDGVLERDDVVVDGNTVCVARTWMEAKTVKPI